MIDEWKKEKIRSEKDLLKDHVEEKNYFIKHPLDEKSPDKFSSSLKDHITDTKLATIDILKKLLKHLLHLYNTKDGYMLVLDIH